MIGVDLFTKQIAFLHYLSCSHFPIFRLVFYVIITLCNYLMCLIQPYNAFCHHLHIIYKAFLIHSSWQ